MHDIHSYNSNKYNCFYVTMFYTSFVFLHENLAQNEKINVPLQDLSHNKYCLNQQLLFKLLIEATHMYVFMFVFQLFDTLLTEYLNIHVYTNTTTTYKHRINKTSQVMNYFINFVLIDVFSVISKLHPCYINLYLESPLVAFSNNLKTTNIKSCFTLKILRNILVLHKPLCLVIII